MPRKKKTDVVKQGIKAQQFDLLLRFSSTPEQAEFFFTDDVRTLLEGLIEHYGTIVLKIPWFSPDLLVIAPNAVPEYALVGSPAPLGATIDQDSTPTMDAEK